MRSISRGLYEEVKLCQCRSYAIGNAHTGRGRGRGRRRRSSGGGGTAVAAATALATVESDKAITGRRLAELAREGSDGARID